MVFQTEQLIHLIKNELPNGGGMDGAIQRLRSMFATSFDAEQLEEMFSKARFELEKEFAKKEILHVHSIIAKRPKWYFGPRSHDRFWPSLKNYLLNEKGWHKDDIDSIGIASDEVVSLLQNPAEDAFKCTGLVVGHVQSGKTANMTAVIAKALDAGYDTVIVLAGLTNKLREQTQARFKKDLVDRRPLDWQVLTPAKDGDFRKPPQGGFLKHTDKAQLAVVKKNVSPLGQLGDAIRETPWAALKQLRVLVIDDECDQASVNAASGELDITRINERIRELLSMLPAVTYVGYTATPFANVLINPYKPNGVDLDDLYPRDFITALPTPKRYFGAEKLFGKFDANGDDESSDGYDMVRVIPKDDVAMLQPHKASEREAFSPEIPKSLEDAMLYFLACCAARRARGQSTQHMTMLIHTSSYVVMHQKIARLIEAWLGIHKTELKAGKGELADRIIELWTTESNRLPRDLTEEQETPIVSVFEHLPDVLDAVTVPIENGGSDDRIDYENEPKTYIAVGGSILARGLTLEGLTVSYFLRSASQYDTLLQMGRWFGYRPGYEDLPRIYTTEDLRLRFRALSGVEDEIRRDIAEYRERDLTPMELAVRVRSIPGMAITTKSKMKAAEECSISYWGAHKQTIRFNHKSDSIVAANWKAASSMIETIEALRLRDKEATAKLWRGVPRSEIINFLREYTPHEIQKDLSREFLLEFVEEAGSQLDKWCVGIVEPKKGEPSQKVLGTVGRITTVKRAQLDDGDTETADIKALMSRQDILIDCPHSGGTNLSWDKTKAYRASQVGDVPLLLLYAIDSNSKPRVDNGNRTDLNAVGDLIGFGIVFPGSDKASGAYVRVRLQEISADEIDEIEREEQEQARAAGVE
ncbi:Z1 domain protein [Ruegeria denitrificans]|uniref:Z1 domain protein n=1 Tax=Ruegeria denitrificans TaxID=1715692 RepID=A0A0N7M849_9RHOB|nr:Z1 domain-containing protein [Ruegeria denitrificans]CUJ83542.1 Z1 domain protein [Ruegeria denitrificans]